MSGNASRKSIALGVSRHMFDLQRSLDHKGRKEADNLGGLARG
jgi:hypothetical protein